MDYIGRKNKPQKGRELKVYNHNCRFHCNQNINEEERRQLFKKFYEIQTYDLQTAFLSSCIKKVQPKRRKTDAAKEKHYSTAISLLGKRVCKIFFLRTFDISVRRFQVVCSKTTDLGIVESDKRGTKEPPNKMESSKKKTVLIHIRMFPKYASHYSRKDNPNARYLSGDLSISKMYKMYQEFCNERHEEPVKESYYRFVFNTEFNLKFHKPYSDTCSRCDNFHNIIKHSKDEVLVNNTKRDLELHQRKAKKANDAKKSDIEANKNSEDTVVICFDLQQTLPTPLLSTSKVFYLRQLWTYNFCVYNLLSGESHMFVWDETIASRGSQEIGSCLVQFIKNLPPNITKIIAYSDSCGGQNKNKNICKLFTFLVQATQLTEIHHKFLEPGHTYMECDRSFGLIEKKKRLFPQVFIPAHWQEVIKNSSTKFHVYNMATEDFYSFLTLSQIMSDPKKSTDGQVLKWRSISWFAYFKSEKLVFKYKHTLDNGYFFSTCSIGVSKVGRRPSFQLSSLKPLNVTTLKIKTAKYKNLISLLDYIPPLYHSFYRNIKHDAQSTTSSSNATQQVSVPDTANDEVEEESMVLESDYE